MEVADKEQVTTRCIICMQSVSELISKSSCGSSFIGGSERKEREEDLNLKTALDLFGSLLSKTGGIVTEDASGSGIFSGGDEDEEVVVYCKPCKKALNDILRLEEIIKQNQAWQMERVESLKVSVVQSAEEIFADGDDGVGCWFIIRDLLLERLNCIRQRQVPNVRRTVCLSVTARSPAIVRKCQKKEGEDKRIQANQKRCSVNLHRLSELEVQEYTGVASLQKVIKTESSVGSFGETEGSRNVRASKQKAFNFIKQSCSLNGRDSWSEDELAYLGSPSHNDNFSPPASSDPECDDLDVNQMKTSKRGPGRPSKLPRPKKIRCETCNRKFSKWEHLDVHMQTHVPKHLRTKFPCKQCGKKLLNKYSLQKHVKKFHQADLSKMDISVEEPIKTDNPLSPLGTGDMHVGKANLSDNEDGNGRGSDNDNNLPPGSSEGDENVFEKESSHKENLTMCEQESPSEFRCETCYRKFSRQDHLQVHMKTHVPKHLRKKFICKRCGKKILRKQSFVKHMKQFHQEDWSKMKILPVEDTIKKEPTIHECKECGRKFNRIYELQAHEQTHVPKELRRKFPCPYCDFKVLSRVALRSHISRQHKPELAKPPRVCNICSKTYHYRDGEGFRIHMRGHTGERPFQCDQCGQSFKSNDQLKKHGLSHNGPRTFQCEFCPMSYKYSSNLKRHLQTAHKDKVPEVDQEEKLKFTNPAYRPDFIGPKIAFPCPICEKMFPLRSRMTKHVKASHGEMADNI